MQGNHLSLIDDMSMALRYKYNFATRSMRMHTYRRTWNESRPHYLIKSVIEYPRTELPISTLEMRSHRLFNITEWYNHNNR